MSTEPTDLFTSTAIYGIHNPVNRHSFSNTNYVFIPLQCYNCEQTVYPFVSACLCLRCRCFVHRSCVMKKNSVCQSFTFNSSRSVSNNENLKNNVLAVNAHNIESIIDRAILVPQLLRFLPEPGSEFCVWRSILRAIARQHISHTRTIPKIDPSIGAAQIQSQIMDLLKDSQSFPGQVVYTVHSVYVKMGFSKRQLESSEKSSGSVESTFDESAVAYDNGYDIRRHMSSSSRHNIELISNTSSGGSGSSSNGGSSVYNAVSSNTDIDTKTGLLHAKECIDTVICAVNTVILDTSNFTSTLIPYTVHGNQTSVTILNLVCATVEQYMLELNFDILYSKLFKFCLLSSPSLSPLVLKHGKSTAIASAAAPTEEQEGEESEFSAAVLPLLSYVNDPRLMLLDEVALTMSKEKRAMGKLQCVVALLQKISSVFTMKKDDWVEYVEQEEEEEEEQTESEINDKGEGSPMGVGVVTHVEPSEEQQRTASSASTTNAAAVDATVDVAVDAAAAAAVLSTTTDCDQAHINNSEVSNIPPELEHGSEVLTVTAVEVKQNKAVLSLLHLRDDTPRDTDSAAHEHSPLLTVEGSVVHYPVTSLKPSGPSIIDLTVPSEMDAAEGGAAAAAPPPKVRPCDLYEDDHGSPVEEILRRASLNGHGSVAVRTLSSATADSSTSDPGGEGSVAKKVPYTGIGSGVKLKKLLKTLNNTFLNVTLNNLQTVTHPILALTMKKTDSLTELQRQQQVEEEAGISLKKAVQQGERQKTLETDELLKIFCSLIVHQVVTNKVPWLADYQYMTSVMLREGDSLLGVEGYALATLEQCIYCLTKTRMEGGDEDAEEYEVQEEREGVVKED